MKRAIHLLGQGVRGTLGVAGSFVLWTVWLALGGLLAVQLTILGANELAIPQFALRRIEARFLESGLRATFGRTSFDPTGRVLVEDVQIALPHLAEPVVTLRSAYVRLNPWMLVVGRVEPREVRLNGLTAWVPAMFSPTGRAVEVVSQVDATLEPRDQAVLVHQLSGRAAGVFVSIHGTFVPPRRAPGRPLEQTIAEFVRERFPTVCRHALQVAEQAARFEAPELHLELTPSEAGAAAMSLVLLARRGALEAPFAAQATELRARTRLLLFGENPASWLEFSAATLGLPGGVEARGVRGEVYGRFQDGAFFFEPRELTLTADALEAAGVTVQALSGQVHPRPLPRIEVDAAAQVLGAPLGIRATADLKERSARAAFAGEISPAVMTPLSERVRVDVRKYFDFAELTVEQGEIRLGAGWKFERLDARLRLDGVNAYGVKMTDGRAVVELEPQRFHSPYAFARVGENFARGTYDHDFRTHQYRFLLEGRLRPLALTPWFKEWWPDFFRQLVFPEAPPAASVDVQGVWREGERTSVFVFADTGRSILRGTEFDRVRTRLFIRPGFFDGLEGFLTRGEGFARGRFAFINQAAAPGWELFEFAADSSLGLDTLTAMIGPNGPQIMAPFQLAQPPELKLRGRFTGAGAREGEHQELRIEARTQGLFRFHEFPLHDASFVAVLKDDEIVIDDVEATVAGGVVAGHARVWGTGEQRRLGFDVSLNDASLGQVVWTAQEFFARQKGQPAPPAGRFIQEKANVKLDFAASAEGPYSQPYRYRGEGNASLKGPEIAEIPLLGSLSELLKFTALRFTEADANFKIEGPRVTFPEIKFRGSNAAIEAHGSYALERRELDFNAKIYPFQESENLIKTVVGAVLTPLSNAFEVKLGGSVDKPEWAFAMAPGNLLRSLAPGDAEKAAETAAPGGLPSGQPVPPGAPLPPPHPAEPGT